MSKGEFWGYYLANIEIGLMYGFILISLNFFILRKYIYSIFDPFALGLLMSSLAYSVVFFMYHLNLISNYYFWNFIATQTAFYLGFFIFKPINIKKVVKNSKNSSLYFSASAKYLYMFSIFLWITSQLLVYYIAGIPLFMDSRLETFSGGTGFGIFNRIIPVVSSISLIIALYRIFIYSYPKKIYRIIDYFIILFALIVAFLSGSKSSLLGIIFIMFFVVLFSYRLGNNPEVTKILKNIRKKQWMFFILAVIASLVVIIIQATLKYGDEHSINPLLSLIMRFVNTGDIYMYAYPNAFLENMQTANPFLALFKDFIGMIRLISWDELPKHIGLQLYQSMYNTDVIMGPNARHNVFGLHYFGVVWSVYFSFLLGLLVSYLRNKLYYKLNASVLGMVVYILIAQQSLAFEVDPPYALSQYISIMTIFLPLLFISYLLENIQKKRKDQIEK